MKMKNRHLTEKKCGKIEREKLMNVVKCYKQTKMDLYKIQTEPEAKHSRKE